MHTKNSNSFYNSWIFWGVIAILATLYPLFNSWLGYLLPTLSEGKYSAIGGTLPYSDARGYLEGAYRFEQMGILDSWSMRRPLNALFFAVRLKLADYNFYVAMILQSFFCAIPFAVYLKTMSKDFGLVATGFSLFYVFCHLQVYGNATLSEVLGLTFGLMSFVLLWNGWIHRKRLIYNIGIAVLTVGLMTRAGPTFMILAALGLVFYKPFTQSRIKDLILSTLYFLIPFIFMSKLPILMGDASQNMALSNFSYTLYGLVKGGKLWHCYLQEPQTMALIGGKTEAEVAKILYKASMDAFFENPFNLVKGIILNIGSYSIFFFKFFTIGEGVIKHLSRIIGVLFWGFVGFRIYSNRKNIRNEVIFFGAFFFAITASAAIIYRDGGIRTFMVAIPFIGAFFSLAFAKIQDAQKPIGNKICIVLFSFILLTSVGNKWLVPTYSIKPQEEGVLITRNLKTYPYVVVDDSINFCHISAEKLKEFSSLYDTHGKEIIGILDSKKDIAFYQVYNYVDKSFKFAFGDKKFLDHKGKWLKVYTKNHGQFLEILSVEDYKQ
jgi:hypothetical protein